MARRTRQRHGATTPEIDRLGAEIGGRVRTTRRAFGVTFASMTLALLGACVRADVEGPAGRILIDPAIPPRGDRLDDIYRDSIYGGYPDDRYRDYGDDDDDDDDD